MASQFETRATKNRAVSDMTDFELRDELSWLSDEIPRLKYAADEAGSDYEFRPDDPHVTHLYAEALRAHGDALVRRLQIEERIAGRK